MDGAALTTRMTPVGRHWAARDLCGNGTGNTLKKRDPRSIEKRDHAHCFVRFDSYNYGEFNLRRSRCG